MRNKIFFIILFLSQFFLVNFSYSNEVEFKAKNIEIVQDKNLTVANDASVFIKKDNISIKGKKFNILKISFWF